LALVRVLAVLLALAMCGCTGLTYVTQAAVGQGKLMERVRDIDELVGEHRVDGRTERLLRQVAVIKAFGERHGLKATTNYTKYAKVEGGAVVWVLSASEPLRFRSRAWKFPLVGSFTYLGWFHRRDAEEYAAELRRDGWDADVRGAGAYSTAGYFEDPVLSSMIPPGNEALGGLCNTLMHESAHSTIFVPHQSTFNESVAKFVGDELAERYLRESLSPDAPETVAYVTRMKRGAQRGQRMHEALAALYASKKTDAEKFADKRAILTQLRADLGPGPTINNATLIQYKTYNSGQAELAALLATCEGDFPRFVRALKGRETARHPKAQEPDIGKMVRPLIDAGCR
jgi:predicted aminopeptidase